jgi:hypothetical protein
VTLAVTWSSDASASVRLTAGVRVLVESAERPVVVVGAQCPCDAATRAALVAFARRFHAPAFTSPWAMGVVGPLEPWFAGTFMNGNLEARLLDQADLILTLGLDAKDFFNGPWRYTAPIVSLNEHADTQRYIPTRHQLIGVTAASLVALEGETGDHSASKWTTDDVLAYRRSVDAPFGLTDLAEGPGELVGSAPPGVASAGAAFEGLDEASCEVAEAPARPGEASREIFDTSAGDVEPHGSAVAVSGLPTLAAGEGIAVFRQAAQGSAETGNVPPTARNVPPTAGNVPSRGDNVPSRGADVASHKSNVPSREPNVFEPGSNVPSRHRNVPSQGQNVPSFEVNVPSRETIGPSRETIGLAAAQADFTIPAALRAARAILPADTLIAVDAGFGKPLASYLWSSDAPHQYFTAHGLSTMGYALPAANALQLAHPGRTVVAFMGDGSLLMRASEITVAVEQSLAPIYVVWVDGALSQIETKQLRQDLRTVGARVPRVNCAKIADAFGGRGVDCSTLADFCEALESARQSALPMLIGAQVDQSHRAEWFDLLRG